MTYRTEDERTLLEEFLRWIDEDIHTAKEQRELVNTYLQEREALKVWGKNEK